MRPAPDEFLPLPYFPWESRPETLPLDADEIATSLFLANGHLGKAAGLLKVSEMRLNRSIRGKQNLLRLIERLKAPY
jgi:hypothetical protein